MQFDRNSVRALRGVVWLANVLLLERMAVLPTQAASTPKMFQAADCDFAEEWVNIHCGTPPPVDLRTQKRRAGVREKSTTTSPGSQLALMMRSVDLIGFCA